MPPDLLPEPAGDPDETAAPGPLKSHLETLERVARIVVVFGAVVSVTFHVLGYFSIRFRFQAFGLDPEFAVISEVFLFEGARLLLFLLALLPPFLFVTLPISLPLLLLSAHPRIRDRLWAAAVAAGKKLPAAPAGLVAAGGLLWASVVLHGVGRHVAGLEDLLFSHLPCEPSWIRLIALNESLNKTSLFFVGLVVALVPTVWGTLHLLRAGKGWRLAAAILGALGLLQALLLPIFFGILVAPEQVDRLQGFEGYGAELEVWHVATDDSRHWFWVRHPKNVGQRTLLVRTIEQCGSMDVIDRRLLFDLLDEGNKCGE